MQYVLPVDLSNVLVHIPVRAQTMLVNGFPVQSVGQFNFDPSDGPVEIDDMYYYDPSNNGLDPYFDADGIDVNNVNDVTKRRIDQAYKDRSKNMKVHPIVHSNKFGINKYPIH